MKNSVNSKNIVDQKTLSKFENLCTQEEPAACIASCPMHVNAKEMINNVREDKWNSAYQIFSKSIPFPEIIAHICDGPCKNSCKRKDIGGSIEIRKLELSILNKVKPSSKGPMFLPKKMQSVAIIGGGLSGMTCAMELCKKGYKVFIYEAKSFLGGRLWDFERDILPKESIEREIESLLKFPVKVFYDKCISFESNEQINEFMDKNSYDAVYISCNFSTNDLNQLKSVFFNEKYGDEYSAIFEIYSGKKAAISIDRFMQKVSINASREKEGPFETTLFTNLSYFKEEEPVESLERFYKEEDAKKEAARCVQCTCLECVKSCAFMKHYKSYPKRYVREVYNNLSIAMGIHHANEMINACSLCGQCGSICPNGLNMADVFLAARNRMNETKKMPPSAFEFAMLDMEYSTSDRFFMAKCSPNSNKCDYIFFPGCQLPASEPELVKEVYLDLLNKFSGNLGLMLSCCGIMAHWSGEEKLFEDALNKIKTSLIDLGSPKIITACPNCHHVLKDIANLEVISIYEILEENVKNLNIDKRSLYIHDACGARNDYDFQNKVRSLLFKMGNEICEMKDSKEKGSCCGYGGLTSHSNRSISNEIINSNIKDNSLSDKEVLSYCINCRDRYLSKGVNSYHILELIYNKTNSINRKSPTWSLRQENRTKFKASILNEIWGEDMNMEEDVKLYFNDDLLYKLEENMILKSDVQSAIKFGNLNNSIFYDPKTKHYIVSHRPKNVTFWVEYEPYEDGYFIYNTYSHRMLTESKR